MFLTVEKKKIPVLLYHSISDQASRKYKPLAISPALFVKHMEYLHQQAYVPLTVSQFMHSRTKGGMPEKPVILTFDDGLADFLSGALPVLQRYGFVATLYVVTAFMNSTSRWLQNEGEGTRPMLTWHQLTQISAGGIECGGHSHKHPQLDTLPIATARAEIFRCKSLLEDHIGQKVCSFAYPYGYHTSTIKELVQEAGYSSACAVKDEMCSEITDPFALSRLVMKADTSVEDLAALLVKDHPSAFTSMYKRSRVPAWRFVRRCSASMRGLHKKTDYCKNEGNGYASNTQ